MMRVIRTMGMGLVAALLATFVVLGGAGGAAPAHAADPHPSDSLAGDGNVTRTVKTAADLTGTANPGGLVDPTEGFGVPENAAPPLHEFNRTLRVNDVVRADLDNVPWHSWNPTVGWETVSHGGFDYYEEVVTWAQFMPYTGWAVEFDAGLGFSVVRYYLDQQFVQHGSRLIPTVRGQQYLESLDYNMIWGTGRAWSEAGDELDSEAATRAAIPYTLVFKEENCSFNGLLTFLYTDDAISNVHYQVGSETCAYFKGNMWGNLPGVHMTDEVDPLAAEAIRTDYVQEQANRMPTKPIAELAIDYPSFDLAALTQGVTPAHTTAYGFVIEGTNYVSDCVTRVNGEVGNAEGVHPYCDQVHLPSYSTAKSIFMGGALMMLVEKYGEGVLDEQVKDWVPELAGLDSWDGVTFAHLVDMATGHYDSTGNQADEAGARMAEFFSLTNRAREDKMVPATGFPKQEEPGERWVYHSSDSFLLAAAMNAYLQDRAGADADIYDMLYTELLAPIGVDADSQISSRTAASAASQYYNPQGAPWGGYGLWWNRDSIAKIGDYFTTADGTVNGAQVLGPDMLAASLQRDGSDRGLPTADDPFMYNNGFWARQYTSADNPAYTSDFWVPFMSGFGGITVAHMPNCTTFWRVSDNSEHAWAPVVAASNAISPMVDGACGAPAGTVDPPVDPPTDPPGDGDNGGNNNGGNEGGDDNGGNGNQVGTEVQLPVGEQRTYVADTGAEGQALAIGIGVLLLAVGVLLFVRRQREL